MFYNRPRGTVDNELLQSCINSVLTNDNSSIEALYGGVSDLRTGLRVLMYQLGTGGLTEDGNRKM